MVELQIAFTDDEDISKSLTDQQTKINSIVSLPNSLAINFNFTGDNLSELKSLYESKSDQEIKSALQDAIGDPYAGAAIIPLLGEFNENSTTAKSTIITLKLDNSNREGENSVQALERVAKVENVMGTFQWTIARINSLVQVLIHWAKAQWMLKLILNLKRILEVG